MNELARQVGGELRSENPERGVELISIDSRRTLPNSLFVALRGQQTDGHRFLEDAFVNGASAAIVAEEMLSSIQMKPGRSLIVVSSPLRALQCLAKWYRKKYIEHVVAITGSNGKTIVKEALRRIIGGEMAFISPGSYNSKLGLPLSILSLESSTPLAILEAGISEPGEMAALEEISCPDFGILTNIGMAHVASFGSREVIAKEKMVLFKGIGNKGWVLLPQNEPTIEERARQMNCQIYWIGSNNQVITLNIISPIQEGYLIELQAYTGESAKLNVRTRSPETIHDLHLAATAAHLLGVRLPEISAALEDYHPSPTRMEVWTSPEGIGVINDAYCSDPISVRAAFRTVDSVAQKACKRIFAFGGMRELGTEAESLHGLVGTQAGECGFSHLVLVGNGDLKATAENYKAVCPTGTVIRVDTPTELKDQLLPLLRAGDTVLFKGPRNSGMVQAGRELIGSVAQRCLWVDLAAIRENVSKFRRHCGGSTKILVMMKALAYGTNVVQLAYWLSRIGIQDVGVSSSSEGIAIRKLGVDRSTNIYVFLSHRDDVYNLLKYDLIPIIYSVEQLEEFSRALSQSERCLDVHLKIDTGMHRLGVDPNIVVELARLIEGAGRMRLTGVCTHFAAADDPTADDFTYRQIAIFNNAVDALRLEGYTDLQIHAANTAATIRFPESHYDMVRVGIGLYGIYTNPALVKELPLELSIALTSRIASLREYDAGSSIGYNCAYTTKDKQVIGVIPFGYDDGLPWGLSGQGHVLVDGIVAPILGRISMDQALIDLTSIPSANIGTEVLLYGTKHGYTLRPEDVARMANTIAHELLVRIGKRVHRVYIEP